VPDEGFEDARWACQKALRAVRGDIRKELEAIADFRDYTEMRITKAGRRGKPINRKEEGHLSHLAAQLIASADGGLAESKRGCGCGGGCGGRLAEASISKMNRKKKAMDKNPKPAKKVKVRPAPFVPLAKSGASVQTMLQGRQKLIKAVEADAEGIKYASVSIIDVKKLDQEDILNGNLGVYLELNAEPPSVYEDVSGEVEYEVSCGGSGEDNFDRTEEYDDDFANGSIQLGFIASLGKDGKPEYRMYDAQYRESDRFSDASYFDDIISSAKGKVLTAGDIDGIIDDAMPSEDTILDAFADDLSERNYGEEDCQGSGNYYY
jgi:hypothetical protein